MVIIMPARRLDFKTLRAEADFAVVLKAYDIDLQKDGTRPGQFKALCPFHEDSKPSLKVNTEKNIYHCFVCDAKGNVLEFVQNMDKSEIRAAAIKLADICGLQSGDNPTSTTRKATQKTSTVKTADPVKKAETAATSEPKNPDEPATNTTLSFTLRLEHPPELLAWLAERGINSEAVETFGLGQVSAKSKSIGGRLAIPLHNKEGDLLGYSGRFVGDTIPDDSPKYILPKGFHKEIELFNLHRLLAQPEPKKFVVLFESYFSVIRHHSRIPAVSPMGRDVLPQQVNLLREAGFTKVLVVFDGDDPGRNGARASAALLAPHFWVRVVDLPDGVKPHRLSWEELRPLLLDAWQ
jgi:DNA primase